MNSTSLGQCNPIKKHGSTLAGEFTQLSNALARDTELSAEAFRVYVLLLSHDDGYRESAVKIAARYGWGKQRAKKALRELSDARLLVVQPHLTERATRAFEKYHVHTTGRFSDADVSRLSLPVGWSKSDQPSWSESDQGVGPNQTKGVGPNRTNKEHQTEHQENNNSERCVSNAGAQDDPWAGYGDVA